MMMTIAELLVREFDGEMAGTRKVLERVPNDKLDWKAHAKSNTIGWNASHLVEIPGWVAGTLTQNEWDIAPKGGEPYRTPLLGNREQMLAEFDKNVSAAREALQKARDEDFQQPWSLLKGGETILSMSRYNVIRSFILNHTIHHRAYLCSYLRLNDIPVPGLYGPSGDEK
jgi:uncharacterized damage-inducible protein DinB